MKRHPLLFSALALVLCILLFNASIVEAAIPVIPIVIGLLVGTTVGFFGGWFAYMYLRDLPESPGVDMRSYVESLFDAWVIHHQNVLSVIDWSSEQMGRYDLYYIRRAEKAALDYLDQQNLPEVVMKDVVAELCIIQKRMVEEAEESIIQLDRLNDGYLTGEASNYDFGMWKSEDGSGGYASFENYNLDRSSLSIQAYGMPTVLWDCDSLTPLTPPSSKQRFDLEKYLYIGQIDYVAPFYGDYRIYSVRSCKDGSCIVSPYEVFSFTGGAHDDPRVDYVFGMVIARWGEIYSQAKSFAQAYHNVLRTLGFTSKSQVPGQFICPVPDVMYYDVNELSKKADFKDIAVQYMAYLQAIGEHLDQDVGCLQGGLVNYTYTTYIVTYTTTVGGSTTVVTETVTTTVGGTTTTITTAYQTVINSTTTTITTTYETVVGGTPTTYVTTYTTVIGGTTATIVATTSGWVYLTPYGVYVPDPFTRLQNATVILPDGTSFTVAEITILDTVADVTFRKGECTTLEHGMDVMIAFYNGTVRTTHFTSDTTICPGKIITPEGELDSYTYKEMPLSYWNQIHLRLETPTFLEPASNTITALISMMIVLMPLLIVVMLMGMISNMVRVRAVDMRRGVAHAETKIKAA